MGRGDGKPGRCFASVTGPQSPDFSCSGGRVGREFWGGHAARVLAMASASCAFDDDLTRCRGGCVSRESFADFESNMNIKTLHIGMKVRHPRYGALFVCHYIARTERMERAGKPRHRWANPRGRESGSERVNGMSDIEGKATRVGASERGQRTSFKIVCCNFCKGLFLMAAWRWVYRKEEARQNHQNPEAPLGFACLYKTQL